MRTNSNKTPKFSAKKKNSDNLLLLISDHRFQKQVELIKSKLEIHDGKVPHKKMFEFAHSVTKLCELFRLPPNYDRYIKKYILYGTIESPLNNFDVIPNYYSDNRLDGNGCPQIRYLSFNIYTKLTGDEAKDMADELDRMGKQLPSYNPLKNIKNKIESEKYAKERDEYNNRPDKEYELTLSEMMEGGKKKVKKAYEDIRELKELRKNRFGKK